MTLNRLVDNAFAEEEQSSFDPASLVPGIAFSHDPVLQGRSFAYRDTDYHRLGTANINNIPINQPIVQANNNQRSEEHTSELQSRGHIVCRLLLETITR